MPSDDLILSLKQIAGYPQTPGATPGDSVLLQRGGLGGPYYSTSAEAFVTGALDGGGPLLVGAGGPAGAVGDPAQVFTGNFIMPSTPVTGVGSLMWNAYWDGAAIRYWQSSNAAAINYDPAAGFQFAAAPTAAAGAAVSFRELMTLSLDGQLVVDGQPMASVPYVDQVTAGLAATVANSVHSFNGRIGGVTLNLGDILCAGGAPNFSPFLQGNPMAPTPSLGSNNTSIATTAFVTGTTVMYINNLLQTHPFVFTVNGLSGDVVLQASDIVGAAPLDSPAFTGNPTAPTPAPGDNSQSLATTAYVAAALVTNTGSILSTVSGLYAPINSPALSGNPTAPTAAPGTSTGQLATTAYVQAAITASTTGVASFNTRTGAVSLEDTDLTNAGGALLDSPVFTGTPQAPTAGAGVATNQIATCAWVLNEIGGANIGVMSFNGREGIVTLTGADITAAGGALTASPTFTGTPQAPTAATGTSNQQIATTAFVEGAIAAGGVVSFNGRNGVVTLTSNDISAAGGAGLVSPAFTGVPLAPTAGLGTNTAQLATCAFVAAAIAAAGGVSTFNGRSGTVTLTLADVTNVANTTYAPIANPTFTGTVTIPAGASIGQATVGGQGFTYTVGLGHVIGFGWTGARLNAYVEGFAITLASLSDLNNYLPLGGGTLSNPLAVQSGGGTTYVTGQGINYDVDGVQSPTIAFNYANSAIYYNPSGSGWGANLVGSSTTSEIWNVIWMAFNTNGYMQATYGPSVGQVTWVVDACDRRLKRNIRACVTDAVEKINALKVYDADVRPPVEGGVYHHWDFVLLADEVGDVIPRARIKPDDDRVYEGIDQLPIVAALVRAVQQLTQRVKALEAKPLRQARA